MPNSFRGDDGAGFSNEHVANGFNDFFASVGQRLEDGMPTSDGNPMDYMSDVELPPHDGTLVTTEKEVAGIIKNLNVVGGGMDGMSTAILLATYQNCIHHLTYFFNLCLHTATFPDKLKVALIIPIYKSGEKDLFTNYRPISLLPIFSKILEKYCIHVLHRILTSPIFSIMPSLASGKCIAHICLWPLSQKK